MKAKKLETIVATPSLLRLTAKVDMKPTLLKTSEYVNRVTANMWLQQMFPVVCAPLYTMLCYNIMYYICMCLFIITVIIIICIILRAPPDHRSSERDTQDKYNDKYIQIRNTFSKTKEKEFGKGQMGSALMGSLHMFCFCC